jgi:predicted dehydrogenase
MAESAPGVVVVGSSFGSRVHVPAARAAGMDVVALVGRDRERTERRAAKVGVEVACTSLAEALALPGTDVVIIATPPPTHAELTEEAIVAGRHVLVEKPFTTDAAEAYHLADLAHKAGVVALVGHEFRFAPARATFQHALRHGLVGDPRIATFVGLTAFAAPLDLRMPEWWFDPARGGGWLGAAVSHFVDAIRVWLGEIESVSAALSVVSGRDPLTTAEDTVSVRFRMRSGCEGVLQHSAAVWGPGAHVNQVAGPLGTLAIVGDAVTFSDSDGTRTLEPAGPPPPEVAPSDRPGHELTHIELGPAITQATVLRALVLDQPDPHPFVVPATFTDGVRCMEVLDAVRRSAAEAGAVVGLP